MQNLELAFFLIAAFLITAVLMMLLRGMGPLRYAMVALPLFCLAAAVLWLPPDRELQALKEEVPRVGREEFVGSQACRSCHIPHYDSWHASYHRTMTQLASEKSVLAPFDGRTLESNGTSCTVTRQGDWFVVDMVDPDWEASEFKEGVEGAHSPGAPRVQLPVVMTTGSHHLQTYWVPSQHGNKVRLFPFVYHIDSQRWIPNGDSFILPPGSKRFSQVWNNSCILCHSVAGDVGYDPGNWQSTVAELGISCEACHGPGAAHIARHNNPVTRYAQRLGAAADPTIVNPARLPHTKSSEICGQCHTGFDEDASTPYNQYRAGGDFHAVFSLADPHNDKDVRFWSDGTMRVGGREFTGLSESACYLKGEISCISCHSMHASNPDKQMRPEMLNNQACTQCHSKIGDDLTAHTHHAADSSGSHCYNCHMPYTSYALFSAIRSHRIDSPSVATSLQSGRPNACNQCHLDQTLGWTSEHLQRWYGTEPVKLDSDQEQIPASLLWLTKGDAVQRVLAAWTMSWPPAVTASRDDWQAAFLTRLLDDPYSMVRYMAFDSLKKLARDKPSGGSTYPEFDYAVSPEKRPPLADQYLQGWRMPDDLPDRLRKFFHADGQLNQDQLRRLFMQRDDRPITLYE